MGGWPRLLACAARIAAGTYRRARQLCCPPPGAERLREVLQRSQVQAAEHVGNVECRMVRWYQCGVSDLRMALIVGRIPASRYGAL